MDPLEYLDIAILMVHSMEYLKDVTANGNLDVLLYVILLEQEVVTVLRYVVRFFNGEVHMSKVQLVIWVL